MRQCWHVERYAIRRSILDVQFSCPARVTNFLSVLLASFPAIRTRLSAPDSFTHTQQVRFSEEVDDRAAHALMTLLRDVVSVCDDFELSECLDFYRKPEEPDQPPDSWPYTGVGQLMYDAKYQSNTDAGNRLGEMLISTIQRHPGLSRARGGGHPFVRHRAAAGRLARSLGRFDREGSGDSARANRTHEARRDAEGHRGDRAAAREPTGLDEVPACLRRYNCR